MAGPDFFNQSDCFIIDVFCIDSGLVPGGSLSFRRDDDGCVSPQSCPGRDRRNYLHRPMRAQTRRPTRQMPDGF